MKIFNMYIKLFFVLMITVFDRCDLCSDSDHVCGPHDINKCISKLWVCDFNNDCQDGSDEVNCPEFKCDINQFKCSNVNKCISKNMICDRTNDCPDESDELNCTIAKKSCNEITEYDCKNPNSLECIPLEAVCNNKFNCSTNKNVKENCNMDMCAENNCSHKCINKYSSFVCSCPPNMIIDKDKRTCKSLKNCLESPQICSQGCTDTTSGYKCFCYKGYIQRGNVCIPQSTEDNIYILYSSYNYIYGVPFYQNDYSKLRKQEKNISTPFNIISFEVQVVGNDMILYSSVVEKDNILSIDQTDSWPFYLNNSSYIKHKESDLKQLSIFSTAFDPARNLLFYTDIKNHSISVMNITSKDTLTIVNKDIVSPVNIVINPILLKIFWIDIDGPKICMSNMDGSSTVVLIEKGLRKPSSLGIDIEDQKLYWIDNLPPTIQYIDISSLNKENIEIISIPNLENTLVQPFSLFIFGNRVYWSDWILNSIFSAHKISGMDVKLISKSRQPNSIRIFSKQYNMEIINKIREQKLSMNCSGIVNNCPYSCLPVSNFQSPICFGFRKDTRTSHMYLWFLLIPMVLVILCLTIYKLRPSKTIIVRQSFSGTVHIRDSVKFWEEDENSTHDNIGIKDTTPIIFRT